jgi:hypothetical protein
LHRVPSDTGKDRRDRLAQRATGGG